MTLTLTAAAQVIDGAGPHVWALNAGTNPGAIVVGIAQAQFSATVTAVDYGGKTLTKREEGAWSVGGHQRGEIWAYIGTDIPTGSNNVTVTVGTTELRSACAYALTADGVIALFSSQNNSGASGSVSFTAGGGTPKTAIQIVAGSVKLIGGSVLSGTTADVYRNTVDKTFTVARDTTASVGARTTGTNNTWLIGAAGILMVEDDVVIAPTPTIGMETGFAASANIVIASSTMLLPETSIGTEVGFQAGIAITKTHARQVALVGEGIDLVEMTEDGTEGQVLMRHAKSKPTWDDNDHDHTAPGDGGVLTNDQHDGYSDWDMIAEPAAPGADVLRLYAEDVAGHTVPSIVHPDGQNIRLGQSLFTIVRNVTGVTIAAGTAVYISGSTGVNPEVTPADASTAATMPALGIVTEELINNAYGTMFSAGIVQYDTSAWASGDELYISETAGLLTDTAPASPALTQHIAYVIAVGVGSGRILLFGSDTHISDGGGADLEVTDESATVVDTAVTKITFPDGSLVDNGVGDVTVREVPAGVLGAHAHRHNATQTLSDATWTKLTLDTSDSDTDGYFDDANDRMTIPAGMSGPHLIFAHSFVDATATNPQIAIYKNGADWRRVQWVSGTNFSGHVPIIDFDAVATDYYEVWAWAATNAIFGHATVDSAQTHIYIHKLGSGNVGDAIGVEAFNSGTQVVSDGVPTALTMDSESWDPDGFHSTSTNTSRLTVAAGLGGKYNCQIGTLVTAGVFNYIQFQMYVNGTEVYRTNDPDPGSAQNLMQGASKTLDLAAGDYVEFYVTPSGAAGTFGHATNKRQQSFIQLHRIGGPAIISPKEGTTFPTGPATDTRYYRTDHDMWFRYDGTRWLSEEVFNVAFSLDHSLSASLINLAVSAPEAMYSLINGLGVYVLDGTFAYYMTATPSGSNYWSVRFRALHGGVADNTFTISGQTGAASEYNGVTTSFGTVVGSSATFVFDVAFVETGSGGTLVLGSGGLRYRIIAT